MSGFSPTSNFKSGFPPFSSGLLLFFLAGLLFGCQAPGNQPPTLNRTPPPVTQTPQPPLQQQEASCGVCGMPAGNDCENRFLTTLPERKFVSMCSAICATSFVTKNPAALDELEVLDFQTRNLVPAKAAFYLADSKLEVIGAMPPTVAAFGEKATAEAARKKNGGMVLDWNSLLEKLKKSPEFQSH